MILFPGRHLMGVLECHQLIPLNNCTFFFSGRNYKPLNIQALGTPPNIPTDGQTTEHFFFPDVIMHYFCEIATY